MFHIFPLFNQKLVDSGTPGLLLHLRWLSRPISSGLLDGLLCLLGVVHLWQVALCMVAVCVCVCVLSLIHI